MKPNTIYLECKDHSVSGEKFSLLYDPKLDLLITHPRPVDLEKYYESEDYISHTDSKKSFLEKIYHAVKTINLNTKTNLIRRCSKNGKDLLDFGSGTGDFLIASQKKGWVSLGVEPNKKARGKAEKKGVTIVDDIDSLPNKKFDVITLWHVLEHLPELELHIKKLTDLLSENGKLIIAVPNYKSYDALYYKQYWAAFDTPRHLWHFSKKSIEALFSPHGFKVIKTIPMYFDAFYVSLLSEKYKNKKQNFLKAMWIGFRSNLNGLRTKEYSSHIYVLQNSKTKFKTI